MTVGLSSTVANAVANALCRNTAWTQPAAVHIKLHVGDPGAAGTSNAATNTTRQQATFGTTASGGALENTVAITWTNVSGAEDYSHYSAWDAASNGNFLFSGVVTANAVVTGDTFTIAIGDIDVSFGPVAA